MEPSHAGCVAAARLDVCRRSGWTPETQHVLRSVGTSMEDEDEKDHKERSPQFRDYRRHEYKVTGPSPSGTRGFGGRATVAMTQQRMLYLRKRTCSYRGGRP